MYVGRGGGVIEYRTSKKGKSVADVIGHTRGVEKWRKYPDVIYLWALIKLMKTTDMVNGLPLREK